MSAWALGTHPKPWHRPHSTGIGTVATRGGDATRDDCHLTGPIAS